MKARVPDESSEYPTLLAQLVNTIGIRRLYTNTNVTHWAINAFVTQGCNESPNDTTHRRRRKNKIFYNLLTQAPF